jgi:hypothetical protein
MDDVNINRAVHDALGFKWDKSKCGVCGWPLVKEGEQGCWPSNCSMRPMPTARADAVCFDYCTDLNAVAMAEKYAIHKAGKDTYWNALQEQFDWPRDGGTDFVDEFEMVIASARQRAEAVLMALGIELQSQPDGETQDSTARK